MSFLSKIFGDANERYLSNIGHFVVEINDLEPETEKLSGDGIKAKTADFKERLAKGETLDDILPEAFALAREASKRTLGQRHFDVQLLGGIVLHQGKIAEMKTGEGKTLVATLPAYLNALEGKGVHVITVNDYLSRRDAVWMGQIYNALGLSVGCINHETSYIYDPLHSNSKIKNQNEKLQDKSQSEREKENSNINANEDVLDKTRDELGSFKVVHEFLRPCSRQEAYACDITYGTNNEFGFDYLRDNMAYAKNQVVQRGHYFVVVDEIDSILIDEARTPLIISGPAEDAGEMYRTFSKIAEKMHAPEDYTVDEKLKAISLTEQGIEKAEKLLGIGDIYTEKGIKYVHHLETAVRANALFKLDKEYVVKNGEIIIVDEFTGRLMPGRRWSDGLHQAVEAKEGVGVQKESRTYASITFQNYFRMYKKLGGMTGTALTSAEEFHKVYKLDTIAMPTNRVLARKDYSDLIYQTEKGKFQAIVEKIKELREKGQPVLVGTVSIQKNEHLSILLQKAGIPHKVLNAKHHEEEGEIVAQAGRRGTVTIATNMAGRGVDIVLGGNPTDPKEAQAVKELGGLCVIGTERHEARRIDNQLRGRAGRQGDPGETRFYVSLEDDVMRIFGSDRIKGMMERFGIPEDQPIENALVNKAIESAQSKIEGFNFDARKHLLDYDDVMNHQRTIIYKRRHEVLFGDNEKIMDALKGIFSAADVPRRNFGENGNEEESTENDNVSKLEEIRKKFNNDAAFYAQMRQIMLQAVDMFWMEHLETMEYLRSSVRLRAYGQKNPLVEYKNEGLRIFRQLEASINNAIMEMVVRMSSQSIVSISQTRNYNQEQIVLNSSGKNMESKEIGRNDPCRCGAKKADGTPVKYKHCCGK